MDDMADLVRRAQDGDDSAFDEIVRRTLPGAYRFLRGLGATQEDAEDAAQEAYVRAWRALGRFHDRKPLTPWLYQIARRALYDLNRSRLAQPFSVLFSEEAGMDATLVDDEPLPDELFEREESRTRVQDALAQLPQRDRLILSLRYDEEFSFEDIGRTLDMPPASARSIHRRALAKLRGILADL